MTEPARIPVIMYHSVGHPSPERLWAELTANVVLFEKQLALLKANGFSSITLDTYRERQESPGPTRAKEVVFTFDDGYLDNWVYAYPLLKREGFRGTIYVNPEFIDPGEKPRPNLDDVWAGRLAESDLRSWGFLNRAELKLMQDSEVMTIASHSMSHTWYPSGPEIVDFHRPGLDTPWLAWNRNPARKFAYLNEDQSGFVPFGEPIHAHGRSLGIRRFIPDPAVADAARAWVAGNGGPEVFSTAGWKPKLAEVVAPLAGKGRYESDTEMAERYRHEILTARTELESIVGQPVNHFCWPGGAYNDASWAIAREAGFKTICVTMRDIGRWNSKDPSLVRRIGDGSNFAFLNGRYFTNDPAFLLEACNLTLGKAWLRWPYRLRKLLGAARSGFRPFKKSGASY